MGASRTISLPPGLTVEEDEEYDLDYRYGDVPIKKVITVKFGDYQVARYELLAEPDRSGFIYGGGDDPIYYYDEPEEFLAFKLSKLFKLIG